MQLAPDKIMHIKGGALFAIGASLVLAVGHYVPGVAIALASLGMGWGVERYQAIRHEGTPSNADMVASAAPGVVAGAVVELVRLFL